MKKCKRFKDPVYGYIDIDETIISDVIDTPCFQRLRDVIQTSYSPLYTSALHNRFVHSLGVYYLGRIVSDSILQRKDEYRDVIGIDRYMELFELACLMHDIGHAPFSHTGENFYLENGTRTLLHNTVIALTGDKDLEEEINRRNYKAASHELMSVIVSLKDYDFLFDENEEKSYFARCILGYPYAVKKGLKYSFLNCIISLLNSTVIDVDKLDYLMRDAFNTGFDTVSIDYVRLLQSIRLIKEEEDYQVVFGKSAISVIENVVYAHDAERKWIQNHPVVQYESYLLQRSMEALKNKYNDVNLFSYDALTETGVEICDNYKVSLLSDADVIFLMKNLDNHFVKEYYNRKGRRHPLWKSEAEYKAIFDDGYTEKMFEIVVNGLEGLCRYLNFVCRSQEINVETLQACKKDIEDAEKLKELKPDNKDNMDKTIAEKRKHMKWMEALEKFAHEQGIPFNFVMLKEDQFNSGFTKEAFAKIQILFDSGKKPCYFGRVTNTLKAEKSSGEKYFYLFYQRTETDKTNMGEDNTIDLTKLAVELGTIALKEAFHMNE